jgi:hypothetical protein
MYRSCSIVALFLLALCPSAIAVDYGKVDRTIAKEPAYKNAPKYALLLFGKEAKLRVWAVLDGVTLYLDRKGNGDLTAKEARFARMDDCRDVQLRDPDGKTTYVIKHVQTFKDNDKTEILSVDVEIQGPLSYQQYGGGALKGSPRAATLAHFHGPLTIMRPTYQGKQVGKGLLTGDMPTELEVLIGTIDDKHGCWVAVRTHHGDKSAFANGVVPSVDIDFPAKTPNGPPLKKRYQLDKFC